MRHNNGDGTSRDPSGNRIDQVQPSAKPDRSGLRRIPSVEKILSDERGRSLSASFGRERVKQEVTAQLERIRLENSADQSSIGLITDRVEEALSERDRPSLRPVINGTGVIIHTNLGRSPVSEQSWREAGQMAERYSNVEFDLDEGRRGRRHVHLSSVARDLFGCEDAILVNNNAAGTLLVLAAVAAGKEVIVSRGELVEIGGGFRVPEVIQQGGAKLREVGTTNKTRAADYTDAVSRRTAALLSVHRSNFAIVGFTESPSVAELVDVARKKKVPLIFDEGSGRVVDLNKYGFASSPTIAELIASGVDIVCCSTDKLIGATQGGLILGRKEIVARCAAHPLMRALRAGKETYGVVSSTLRAFLADQYESRIPIYRMLATPLADLRKRAEELASGNEQLSVREMDSVLGGGTTPAESIPSAGVEIKGNAHDVQKALLGFDPPIVGRIESDRFQIDLRTVFPDEDQVIAGAIRRQS